LSCNNIKSMAKSKPVVEKSKPVVEKSKPVEVKQVEVKTEKKKQVFSDAQKQYAKYRDEKWQEYKKDGKTFKSMLQDQSFKDGWMKQKNK
jgi:cell envelope opacity-associated protein A